MNKKLGWGMVGVAAVVAGIYFYNFRGDRNGLLALTVENSPAGETVADEFKIINYSSINKVYLGGLIIGINGITEAGDFPMRIKLNEDNYLTYNAMTARGAEYILDYPVLIDKEEEQLFSLYLLEADEELLNREIFVNEIIYRKAASVAEKIYQWEAEVIVKAKKQE